MGVRLSLIIKYNFRVILRYCIGVLFAGRPAKRTLNYNAKETLNEIS